MPSGRNSVATASVERLVLWMESAHRVLVITGAGMSADSGVPTYRGVGGLYEGAGTEDGIPIERALSGEMLLTNPELCWKYIAQIEKGCRGAQPNAGHYALAALEHSGRDCWILTRMWMAFIRRGSQKVMSIHGDVHQLECTACRYAVRVPDYAALTLPPSCPECGHLVRPRVVLFGEPLPYGVVHQLHTQLALGFDLILSIGTTMRVPVYSGACATGGLYRCKDNWKLIWGTPLFRTTLNYASKPRPPRFSVRSTRP